MTESSPEANTTSSTGTIDSPAREAAGKNGLPKLLADHRIRMIAAVLGAAALVGALIGLGIVGQVRLLLREVTGQLVPVLVLLILGLLLLAVSMLGAQIAVSPKQLAPLLVIVLYLLLSWLVLSNLSFFVGSDAAQASAEAKALGTRLQAITFGIASVLFLFVAVIVVSYATESGTRKAVADALSHRTSTAPTVILLWSAVVVYAVAFIASSALTTDLALECGPDDPTTPAIETATTNCIQASAWPDYLLLLGLPGAAAAIAKSRKVQPSEPPTEADKPGTSSSDRITEVQFLVFNVIAMVFVVWSLATRGVLGNVPDVLLGLTGASALTFSLAKRLPPAPTP